MSQSSKIGDSLYCKEHIRKIKCEYIKATLICICFLGFPPGFKAMGKLSKKRNQEKLRYKK